MENIRAKIKRRFSHKDKDGMDKALSPLIVLALSFVLQEIPFFLHFLYPVCWVIRNDLVSTRRKCT